MDVRYFHGALVQADLAKGASAQEHESSKQNKTRSCKKTQQQIHGSLTWPGGRKAKWSAMKFSSCTCSTQSLTRFHNDHLNLFFNCKALVAFQKSAASYCDDIQDSNLI